MQNPTSTKIFLDSGDPALTRKTVDLLGFLDGQTTNPSLVVKVPALQEKISGEKLTNEQLFGEYKQIISQIEEIIPHGDISIEVYADNETTALEMVSQARELNTWIERPYIKLPTNPQGLEAASILSKEGILINMTLCFTQKQAAAVYSATVGSSQGSVFVSPFIGRLDDIGIQGMDLIKNIHDMYSKSDHHVELLTASVRSLKHFLYALYLEVDIITAPFEILQEWSAQGKPVPGKDLSDSEFSDISKYFNSNLEPIPYEDIDLTLDFKGFDVSHELTTKGIEKFASDWNSLLKID